MVTGKVGTNLEGKSHTCPIPINSTYLPYLLLLPPTRS